MAGLNGSVVGELHVRSLQNRVDCLTIRPCLGYHIENDAFISSELFLNQLQAIKNSFGTLF